MKKLIASAAVSAVLATGGVAVAGAADTPDSAPAAAADGQGARLFRAIQAAAKVAAETIGVDVSELRDAVRTGKTIAEIATEHGVDPATVVAAVVAAGRTRIDEAVTDGRLDEERATKLEERLPEIADRLVNSSPRPHRDGSDRVRSLRRQAIRQAAEVAAETIGVEVSELRDAVRQGRTVADVATDHGVDPATVVDAVIAEAKARIDQDVADGRIDEERAAKLEARFPELADRFVSSLPQRQAPAEDTASS